MQVPVGEVFDFLAGIFIQYGNYLKIQKRSIGWAFSIVGIIYWICRAKSLDLNAQSFWHMVSLMMASYGFWSWRKQNL